MAEPANTPVPASTPRATSPAPPPNAPIVPLLPSWSTANRPAARSRVLHLGDPVRYNPGTFASFSAQYEIVRPSAAERQRPEFIRALGERRWGDFEAIFRPFWGTGGEMGNWDAELVDLLPPGVRVFASAGAGFDWADTELLGKRGIIYCNSGRAACEAVADFAMAMIISTFRHLPWCMGAAASGDPDDFAACHRDATAVSRNLRGLVLGVVGFGDVGRQIAHRSHHGFGMDVHYHDVAPIPAGLAACASTSHDSLEGLIRASDCVVLCAPAAPGGGCLLGEAELGWFRGGGRLVNVARGSLVDDGALADALDAGRLSSVALDVHPDEPRVSARLRAHAAAGRAMLTCHNAGGTVETHAGFEELSMRNVMAVLEGGEPITPVNLHHLG